MRAVNDRLALTARRLTLAIGVVLALGVAIFLIRGADRTVRPRLVPHAGSSASRVAGFNQVAFRISRPGAAGPPRRCALLALTTAQQNQGLMNRRDLAGYDGMIFQWTQPTTSQFYMKDTLIPLSIAWFDASGQFVSSTDMPPCVTADCPLFSASAPYTTAIEVARGRLSQLGIGAGSIISVGGGC